MLKTLLLRSKIDKATKALEDLRKKDADFDKREQEIRSAFEEVNEETTAEEREAVEASIAKFDEDKAEHEKEKQTLSDEISGYEKELADAEAQQEPKAPAQEPVKEKPKTDERGSYKNMKTRFLQRMSASERKEFIEREDTKKFLANIRTAIKEKRSITGAELLIPEIAMPMLRSETEQYSKLLKHVNVMDIPGKGRQTIAGDIPEAVWTEACAKLNELNFAFNAVDVDAYKVGGFIPICNAVLEDSDTDLADTLMEALGAAIGRAIDKAILFGTGVKMPLGIATRLAQETKPSGYPTTARPWADLHTSNIKNVSGTGSTLFANITKATAAAKGKYSNGDKFWAMNGATKMKLIAEALSFNASGAIVTSVNDTMPVIGGDIVVIDDIADDTIIGGYGDEYLLAERAGTTISQSEHVRFIEDQTVIKGTARYDGQPAIAEGFVAIGLGVAPTTTATFATDTANTAHAEG